MARQPTIAQRITYNEVLGQIARGERANITKAMKKAGYAPSTIRKQVDVTRSNGWKALLAQIDDNALLSRVSEIALAKEDKRASLQAVDMLMKLKDRYPAGKLKVTEYDEEISKLQE
jgi:hypothetical protein